MLTDPLPIFCSTNKRLKQLFFYSKILNFLHSLIHIVVDPLSYLRAWYLSRKISWRPIIRKRALGLINEEPWRSISIRVIPISFFREWRVVTGGRGWDRSDGRSGRPRQVSTPADWFRTSSTPIGARSRRNRIACRVSGRPIAPLTLQFMPGPRPRQENRSPRGAKPSRSPPDFHPSPPLSLSLPPPIPILASSNLLSIQAFSREIFPRLC